MALRRYLDVGNDYGANPQDMFPEAASQAFIPGDLLTLSSGKAAILVAAGNAVGATAILGISNYAATGVTNNIRGSIDIATAGTFMELPYTTTDAAATPAITDIGVSKDLRNTTSGFWSVNSTTSNVRVVIQQINREDSPAWPTTIVAGGRVRVKFLAAARVMGVV